MKRSHLSSYALFVEGLLGAAVSLKTSMKILLLGSAALESPSMQTVRLAIHIPVVTIGPSSMESREGGPHKDVVDVETMVVRPPGGY